jgi:RimJ/RimL family protein N-acetyltransferase
MPHHVHRLSERHRSALKCHFVQLDVQDRQLRFGTPISDSGIDAYVDGLDFESSDVFAVFDDKLAIIGAMHIAYDEESAEMGLSVARNGRGQGIGNSLFERATVHLSNRYIRTVYMHCLRENDAIMHLAKKHGMRIVADGSEADAWLALPHASPGTVAAEWVAERFAMLDYRQKMRARSTAKILKAIQS